MQLELRTFQRIRGTSKGKWGLMVYRNARSLEISPPVFKSEKDAIEAGNSIILTVENKLVPDSHKA